MNLGGCSSTHNGSLPNLPFFFFFYSVFIQRVNLLSVFVCCLFQVGVCSLVFLWPRSLGVTQGESYLIIKPRFGRPPFSRENPRLPGLGEHLPRITASVPHC